MSGYCGSLNHDKPEKARGFAFVFENVKRDAVVSDCREHVYPARLHGGHGLIGKIAVLGAALGALFARAGTERYGFIIVVEENLSCRLHRKRRHKAHFAASEQYAVRVLVKHFARLTPRWAVRRAAMAFSVCTAPKLAFVYGPWGGYY